MTWIIKKQGETRTLVQSRVQAKYLDEASIAEIIILPVHADKRSTFGRTGNMHCFESGIITTNNQLDK